MPKFEFKAEPGYLHFVEMARWSAPNDWIRIYDNLEVGEDGWVSVEVTESAMYRAGTKY